jgi:exodeoxyribonuclease V alpha subunit
LSNQPFEFTDEQLAAVEMVKANAVSILTGGPGCGKTTTVKEVIRWAQTERLSIEQCAPTGKAAKRMTEATGYPASTIHRLLGARGVNDEGDFDFELNEDNPLNCDLLIVDEASMISNDLMAVLMRAIDEDKTRLLIVGDQGQLPSVGAGAVLRDLLASGCVPHVELTKIHRNSGLIVRTCHQIKRGEAVPVPSVLDLDAGLNLRHVEVVLPELIAAMIEKLVVENMVARGYDPVWDVQVISPVNSRTVLACDSLNQRLQMRLNAGRRDEEWLAKNPAFPFRENDKVIQTKNVAVEAANGEGAYIVNGDMGTVSDIRPGEARMQVTFFDPERVVLLPKKKNNLLLAYCCTCHRMQGSEAPVVIIPVHRSFGFFVNRPWIYTAISRAQTIAITVGQFAAFTEACARNDESSRQTLLAEKIRKGMQVTV